MRQQQTPQPQMLLQEYVQMYKSWAKTSLYQLLLQTTFYWAVVTIVRNTVISLIMKYVISAAVLIVIISSMSVCEAELITGKYYDRCWYYLQDTAWWYQMKMLANDFVDFNPIWLLSFSLFPITRPSLWCQSLPWRLWLPQCDLVHWPWTAMSHRSLQAWSMPRWQGVRGLETPANVPHRALPPVWLCLNELQLFLYLHQNK